MQMHHLRAARAFVQVIHVLCDDRQFRYVARQRRDGIVRGVGRGAQHLRAPPFIPTPDNIGMRAKGLWRGQGLRVEARPQPRQGVAKGGDAAFGRHAGACENHDTLRAAQRIQQCLGNIVMRVFHFNP
ncbi:hypothetical protein D3C72_1325110 [compost metagenome]